VKPSPKYFWTKKVLEMAEKPTYKELEQRVKELEKTVLKFKLAEEALIESEKLFRLIVENVTDVIWIVDMEMKFTYFSPSVTQMRGYSVQEAMAQPIGESMTPATFESVIKMIAEELELHNKGERDFKRSKKIEAELTCKDGSTVWTEIESNFIYNSKDQPTGILGITRNITERKEFEKERNRAEIKRNQLILKLQQALAEVKTLSGLVPICSYCKKIRDDKGYWNQIESYIRDRSDAEFSHGICPECAKKLYPDMDLYDDNGEVTEH
jgi:PAS domain S-box-containing protein